MSRVIFSRYSIDVRRGCGKGRKLQSNKTYASLTQTCVVCLMLSILASSNASAVQVAAVYDPDKPGSKAGWDSGYAFGKTGRPLPVKKEQQAIAKRAALRKQVPVSARSTWMSNFVESFLFGFVDGSDRSED